MRRHLLPVCLLSLSACTAPSADIPAPAAAVPAPAAIPVFDGHIDVLVHWAEPDYSGWKALDAYDFTGGGDGQVDLPRLRRGGAIGGLFTIAALGDGDAAPRLDRAMEQLRGIAAQDATLVIADDIAALERAHAAGDIAVMPALEGAEQLGDGAPEALAGLARETGLRSVALTWSRTNAHGDAAGAEPQHDGLSASGEALLRSLQRAGVLVDLSHAADTTVRDAQRVAEAPLLFSHSSARALCDSPRNLPDDLLREIAARGGLVMVTFVPYMTRTGYLRWYEAGEAEWARLKAAHGDDEAAARTAMAAWEQAYPAPAVGVADVADHVEHVRRVAGLAHVGIGSDFDGMYSNVSGLADAGAYPALFAELRRRGWDDDALAQLGWLNFVRVARAAEAFAAN